jgi:glycosyltransferase involved in cell wall biosynthesis
MPDLSVLHISFEDNIGGSAKAAYKIHLGLRDRGVNSKMLVRWKITSDPDVGLIAEGNLNLLDQVGRLGLDKMGLQYLFYPSSFALLRHPLFQGADIIQLYNVHGGFFSHSVLPMISSRMKKIVWRLSDMWPLTGHCSYSYECDRWKSGCGECPNLAEYPPLSIDFSSLLWRIKSMVYERSDIHVVTTNSWMTKLVEQSPLLRRFERSVIPNGINTETFSPIPKATAREALGLPRDSKVVLFASHAVLPGKRKGAGFIIPTMEKISSENEQDLVLIVLGEKAESWKEGQGYRTVRLGFTQSERLLAVPYSAADVLLYPSIAENFPNSVVEAFACGTVAVGFDIGGMSDAIRHMETGYLARYGDMEDLAAGVNLLLKEDELRAKMSERCRRLVQNEYSLELQAKRFEDLYRRLLDQRRNHVGTGIRKRA